jgi:hypothetical protein
MKKLLFLSLAMGLCLGAWAQKIPQVPAHLQKIPATRVHTAVDIPMDLSNGSSSFVRPLTGKAPNEVKIGETRYDLQSNQAVQNRIYLHPDGTIAATWTYGMTDAGWPDRGTGYNYYDGTSWGAYPTARIEPMRTGWPSYFPLPGGAEGAISHNGSTGLQTTTRPAKGTGAWSSTALVGPTTSGGFTALLWPRAISSGNTIHLIACTDQSGTAGVYWYYEGLSLALVYYKSTDGGATWSAPQVLPGMDSASYVVLPYNRGYKGDSYSWAAPRGDTVAFIVGDSWSGLFAMKSFDAGVNWTKIPIFNFPNLTTTPTGIIPSIDGAAAIAIDDLGQVHAVTGRMRVSDDNFADETSSYYPYTDGLVYWNETMSIIDTGTLNDELALFANGQWLTGMWDHDGSGEIEMLQIAMPDLAMGAYYLSLTSMPQINVDGNNIFVTYSSVREDKNDGQQHYRHLYAMWSGDLGANWGDPMCLTNDIVHEYAECVFPSLSYTMDDYLHIVYQADGDPGLAIRGDEDPIGDNDIMYLKLPKTDITGMKKMESKSDFSLYPNPANDYVFINLNLGNTQKVKIDVINIVGQTMYSKDYGVVNAGDRIFKLNTSNLTGGIYLVSIQTGNENSELLTCT